MHKIQNIVDDMHLSTGDRFATVWGKIYGNWITDEVNFVLYNIGIDIIFWHFMSTGH